MEIKQIFENKKQYIDLLLLADEQESMIDKYLERGDMFVLCDDDLKAICVVTNEGKGIFEIKNIATVPKYQGQGYGKQLVNYLSNIIEANVLQCSSALVIVLPPFLFIRNVVL